MGIAPAAVADASGASGASGAALAGPAAGTDASLVAVLEDAVASRSASAEGVVDAFDTVGAVVSRASFAARSVLAGAAMIIGADGVGAAITPGVATGVGAAERTEVPSYP